MYFEGFLCFSINLQKCDEAHNQIKIYCLFLIIPIITTTIAAISSAKGTEINLFDLLSLNTTVTIRMTPITTIIFIIKVRPTIAAYLIMKPIVCSVP